MTMSTTMTATTPTHTRPRRLREATVAAGESGSEQMPGEVDWRICRFSELSPVELARIYRARQQVFTIEQQCIYLDADEFDEVSWHIAAWSPALALPLAYARLVNPGGKYAEPSIGRVVTAPAVRGRGAGRALMVEGLARCDAAWPGQGVRISAQSHLARFYGTLGFDAVGEPCLEDGIPHVEMLRRPR